MKHTRFLVATSAALLAASVAIPFVAHAQKAPADAPVVRITANHKKTDQMRGFSMQLNDPAATDSNLRAIDELADMGCTWINLAIAGRQQDVHAQAVTLQWTKVPSEKDILRVMAKAKSRGMGVMVMPMVLLINTGSKDWRGIIDPTVKDGDKGWDMWFATYTDFITYMAKLANRGDADIFCVGSELLSTEPYRDRWLKVIASIKQEYKGKLTYSANWDHYSSVTFWDQLDYIGMNNYNELSRNADASVSELDEKWGKIKKDVLDFAATQHKPFMFTEVGWHNKANTLAEPWNYVSTAAVDHKPQLHAFQSFVDTWGPVPKEQFMGAFIWEWCPNGKVTDPGTYSLQDTPALEVVKKWFTLP